MFESIFGLDDEGSSNNHYNYDASDDSYQTVSSENIDRLNAQVNSLMRRGWRPQGGIAVVGENNRSYKTYIQAMVKGI
ncbi:DUF1737 domain-containing protein [Weissella sagaensis]|uniref:DUF1737 domain-containing protein n=1 Tax=Weissella sagaensis TaxID=2559928 RepID=UPI0013ED705A|nr:DUF1737 domain-containing protein [Weissella sagaensis]